MMAGLDNARQFFNVRLLRGVLWCRCCCRGQLRCRGKGEKSQSGVAAQAGSISRVRAGYSPEKPVGEQFVSTSWGPDK